MREDIHRTQDSLTGSLLLAHPGLRDQNFKRTVVLMTSDGAEGAIGVVLNRPLNRRLGDLGGEFALSPLSGIAVFQGGPVQTEQLILAAWKRQAHGFQLHLGIEPAAAINLLDQKNVHVRAYFGYAGWSPGQLKNELKQNTWIVADAPTDLFERPGDATLWRNALGREGLEWRLLADEPEETDRN